MRFITGEIKEPSSIYRYWVTDIDSHWRHGPPQDIHEWCKETWSDRGELSGIWNWSFSGTRTVRYYFVKEQDMTLFLLKWS